MNTPVTIGWKLTSKAGGELGAENGGAAVGDWEGRSDSGTDSKAALANG